MRSKITAINVAPCRDVYRVAISYDSGIETFAHFDELEIAEAFVESMIAECHLTTDERKAVAR